MTAAAKWLVVTVCLTALVAPVTALAAEPKGGKEPAAALVGSWRARKAVQGMALYDITLRFEAGGRFAYDHTGFIKSQGTYTADSKRIYLTPEGGVRLTLDYSLRGDQLTVSGLLGVPAPLTLSRRGAAAPKPGPAKPPSKVSKESAAALVGAWRARQAARDMVLYDITVRFEADGGFAYDHTGFIKSKGTYTASPKHIYVTLQDRVHLTLDYRLGGNQLTVTGLLGVPAPLTLTRQQEGAPAPKAGPDLSTPQAAAKAFIRAAQSKDIERLSQCLAANAEEELQKLRTKTANARELDEIAAMFQGARVGETRVTSERTATVRVRGPRVDESLQMAREGGAWKLVGF